jgi:hypothetical protein
MQDNEMDMKPIRAKRQRFNYIREQGVRSITPIKLEYNFIYEEVKVKGPRSRYNTFITPFINVTLPSSDSLRSFINLKDND